MRKSTINIFAALLTVASLGACSEQEPDLYSAPDGIYLNNRTSANRLVDSTAITFVYESDDVQTIDVPVAVQSIGRQSDSDRPVNIRVWSDDAVEGQDYELITPPVLPALTSSFNYVIRLKRSAAIRNMIKTVYVEVAANEYFTTFFERDSSVTSGDRPYTEMLRYRISFSDFYSTAPAGWRQEYVGAFSERKLRLLWKLFDDVVSRADYNVAGKIPFNKWVYMQSEVDKYMFKQQSILLGYESGEVDPDALEDPDAEGSDRRLLDFTPIVTN